MASLMPRHQQVLSSLSLLLHLIVAAPATSSVYNHSSNCTRLLPDAEIVRKAFLHVGSFPLRRRSACHPVRRLRFPSKNLTGVLRWEELANLSSLLTLDLSGNSLQGDVHSAFWRAPSLRAVDASGNRLGGALRFDPSARLATLNVSGNRFTSVDGVERLVALEILDLSGNIIGAVPEGLPRLTRIRRLDLSRNMMAGVFPDDFPPLDDIDFLNISHNSFSCTVDADTVLKFGRSAFFQAGNASLLVEESGPTPAPTPPTSGREKHRRVVLVVVVVIVVCSVVVVAALVILVLARCVACRKKDKDGKKLSWAEEEVEVGAVKVAATAPVVVLERPLLNLTLADLATATSGFGRESQLADVGGRSGAAYRAVLPGDLDVVVRVVEGSVAGIGEDDDAAATAAGFRELARLRHPNILPLLGYCIAGKEKLLLYEYMEKGDLHRWLHELPVGSMDAQETSIDTLDAREDNQSVCDWPTRHRMILGIARGLAFLHQGWAGSGRPIVHGHLVPTNVLLGDDLEPRISDFMHHGGGSETPEKDVYSFGVLVLELVMGQAKWDEATVGWARGVIRNKKGENIVDARLKEEDAGGSAAEREAAECLQVGFLCTAPSPHKRPTMQQVVGVLKDIRPAPAGYSS
uniref:Uncharacterized protein n=1 Tax=Avena sativa TaxID=4498 RepID=A0ACD5Z4V1_AVESA